MININKIIYYFHNIIYNTYLMERQFKSERDKIEYYKKLRVKENNIAQKNMDNITEAYHEIEFGIVPEVIDNRSLSEKIADERGQQLQAQKNALTLMSNDGEEAIKLQNLIGTARYQDFNRYFLDIYEAFKNQIGRIRAQEAYDYIDKYIIKTNLTKGVDIPNVDMLNQLITAIQNIQIPAPQAPQAQPNQAPTEINVDIDLSDVVLRLQALEHVLTRSADTLDRVEYNTSDLPSRQDIQDILTELQNMGNAMAINQRDTMRTTLDTANFIRDEVRAVGNQVRNEGIGNSLRFNEVLAQLRAMVNSINADSLSNVIQGANEEDEDYDFQDAPEFEPEDDFQDADEGLERMENAFQDDNQQYTANLYGLLPGNNEAEKREEYIAVFQEMSYAFTDPESIYTSKSKPNAEFTDKLNFLLGVIGKPQTKAITFGSLKTLFRKNASTMGEYYDYLNPEVNEGVSGGEGESKTSGNGISRLKHFFKGRR